MTDRPLMGGYSNAKEITDTEKEILEKIKSAVESSIGKTFTKFNGINFKSQVVAGNHYICIKIIVILILIIGTNYHFKVETDDDILHIKVLR